MCGCTWVGHGKEKKIIPGVKILFLQNWIFHYGNEWIKNLNENVGSHWLMDVLENWWIHCDPSPGEKLALANWYQDTWIHSFLHWDKTINTRLMQIMQRIFALGFQIKMWLIQEFFAEKFAANRMELLIHTD